MSRELYEISLKQPGIKGKVAEDYSLTSGIRKSLKKNPKRVVLLVHGFNTTYEEAKKSYNNFKKSMCKTSRNKIDSENIWFVYWSGEGDSQGLGRKLRDSLSYPQQIENAKLSAELLARFLNDYFGFSESSLEELIIIGHSLGCRVILETFKKLFIDRSLIFASEIEIKICLMAAAIPYLLTEKVARINYPSKELFSPINLISYRLVLFSDKDIPTLGLFFNKGQEFAREDCGEAVGLNGKPFLGNIWTDSEKMKGFKHQHYWANEKDNVVRCIYRYFNIIPTYISDRSISYKRQIE